MIMPNKIIQVKDSLFYYGSIIVQEIMDGIDDPEKVYRHLCKKSGIEITYEKYCHVIDFLFILGILEISDEATKFILHK